MNLHEQVSELIIDTKGAAGGWLEVTADSSIGVFAPELFLCGAIILMLLLRISKVSRKIDAFYIAMLGVIVAMICNAPWQHLQGALDPANPASAVRMEIFTGMLVFDTFTVFARTVLIGFAILFLIFTKLSGIPDKEDGADIYALVLGSTLGMCLMASANHLIMVFMAVEMASVPSYALAGMLKGRKKSSEAALKYAVYGAGAAGVMLYGISLLAGLLNTAHMPTMAVELAEKIHAGIPSEEVMVLTFAALMLGVGLAFKLSAVPFHFWCPDVFEGAAAEVGAFLSIASKAAALVLLVRVAIGFGAISPEGVMPGERTAAINMHAESDDSAVALHQMSIDPGFVLLADDEPVEGSADGSPADDGGTDSDEASEGEEPAAHSTSDGHTTEDHTLDENETAPLSHAELMRSLAPVRDFIGKFIALLAVITCTFGNLAAYTQTNIKRLMAYSTIAHAGYMMMAVPPVMVMAGTDNAGAEGAVAALCIYIGIYLFMNLGAFAIIAFMRNSMGSEEIADYGGLIRRQPAVVVCFTLILVSLVGIPPLAGFIGKFAIFAALVEGFRVSSEAGAPATYLLVLLIAAGVNTAISLFYYLRVIKTMTMEPEPESRPPFAFSSVSLPGLFMCVMAASMLVLFLFWDPLSEMARAAAQTLLS